MKKRVLLVEDFSDLRMIFSLVLQRAGYEVITADDGLEGLALFVSPPESLQFDGIWTDIQMPRMDGLTMAKAIRKHAPDIPIVFASGDLGRTITLEMLTALSPYFHQKGAGLDELKAVTEMAKAAFGHP